MEPQQPVLQPPQGGPGAAPAYSPPPAAVAAAPPAGYHPPAAEHQPAADPNGAAYAAPIGQQPLAPAAAVAPHLAPAHAYGATPPTAAPPAAAGAKRPFDETSAAPPGAGHLGLSDGYTPVGAPGGDPKRQHMAPPADAAAVGPSPASVPRETIYRLVLDVADTALIIGKGGNTVRTIEQATGGRVKRLQEPPGARQQTLVVWTSARELPSPGRATRNAAQEALMDCVRRVVFQENAPMGRPMSVRILIGRSQEAGALENMDALLAENPGVAMEVRRGEQLPPCALDNDVLIELSGEKYALLAVVEALSHVLREHPIMERPGGPPPALRGQAPAPGSAAAPPPVAAGIPGYAPGGFRRY